MRIASFGRMRGLEPARRPDMPSVAEIDAGYGVLSGTVATVLRTAAQVAPASGWTMLLYTGGHGRPGSAHAIPRAFLLTTASAHLPIPGDTSAVALVLDRALLRPAVSQTAVELRPTSLLRASRSFVESLESDARRGPGSEPLAASDLVASVVRAVVGEQSGARPPASGRPRLEQLEVLIELRHRDPDVTVDSLARELFLSRRQLYRLVEGEGVAAMLSARRVATACRLMLLRPHVALGVIAHESGFRTPAALRAQFQAQIGVAPSVYRRRLDAAADADHRHPTTP